MYISLDLKEDGHDHLLKLARMLCDVVGTHTVVSADNAAAAHAAERIAAALATARANTGPIETTSLSSSKREFSDPACFPPAPPVHPAVGTPVVSLAMPLEIAAVKPALITPADNPETGAPVPPPPTPVSEAAAAFGAVPLPPAPPVVAVTPSVAPASGPSATGVLDADGLPWDARIHAGGQAKNTDGRWRARRGVNDAALVARVTAELRAAMGAPAAPPAVPTPPVPPAPPTPPAAPAALGPGPDLCLLVTRGKTAGWLTDAHVVAACQAVGLPGLPLLAQRHDLIPAVRAAVEAYQPAGAV